MILTHITFSSAFYATVSINVVLNTPSDVDNVGDRGPLRLPDTPGPSFGMEAIGRKRGRSKAEKKSRLFFSLCEQEALLPNCFQ